MSVIIIINDAVVQKHLIKPTQLLMDIDVQRRMSDEQRDKALKMLTDYCTQAEALYQEIGLNVGV